jgi:ABC-type amino acid transport substrate-binding protein
MNHQRATVFRRSSFCNAGDCVEVAQLSDGRVAIRDSKDDRGSQQIYTPQEWAAFLRGAKSGEFDFGMSAGAGVDSATVRFSR